MASGRIDIDIGVDAGEATQNLSLLDKALAALADQADQTGVSMASTFDDVDESARLLAKQTGSSFDEARSAIVKFKGDVETVGTTVGTELPANTDHAVKGLDTLRGNVGEVSSSFGQFGGAISIVNPQLGLMASQVGALAGGLEGATKMTKLTGGSVKSLMVAGGALTVAVGALGVAWHVFSGRLKAANERIRQSHEDMQEGIARAKEYKMTLLGLQNAVGLLGDAEFARAQAAKMARDATKEDVEEQAAMRSLVGNLRNDIIGLEKAEADLLSGRIDMSTWNHNMILEYRDISKALEETNEQIEAGGPIMEENGMQAIRLFGGQKGLAKSLEMVRSEIENTKGSLKAYTGQIDAVDRRTERLNLLFQIQSAQAREDKEEVRELALALAILEDVEVRLHVAALKAAEAMAIQSLQMANMGPATVAGITAIQKLFDTLEDDAPSGFKKTLDQLNTALDDNTDSTGDSNDEGEDAVDLTERRKEALDMLAEAMGQGAVIEREYAKALAEVDELIADGVVNEQEAAQLFASAYAVRVKAVKEGEDEIRRIQEEAAAAEVAALQAKLDLVGAFATGIGEIAAAAMSTTMQQIDEEEEKALAAAGENIAAQEEIQAEFDARRKSELGGLFKLQQATQIASAIMSGASAGVGALAPPPVGLGPNPAGLAMVALVAATTAAQVAVIASQQPAFHQGGIVGGQGDQPIMAQGGEVVLNREAVAGLGGSSAANGLNTGGGTGGTVVVQMTYKQRVFDQVVADNLAKGGPLKNALNKATRAGKRRVGGLL